MVDIARLDAYRAHQGFADPDGIRHATNRIDLIRERSQANPDEDNRHLWSDLAHQLDYLLKATPSSPKEVDERRRVFMPEYLAGTPAGLFKSVFTMWVGQGKFRKLRQE